MLLKKKGLNFTVSTRYYTLKFDSNHMLYVDVTFNNGIGSQLFVASGCDKDGMIDELIQLNHPLVKESSTAITLVFEGKTTLWEKVEYIFECSENKILYHYVTTGNGSLDNARFFEGFEADNPATKNKFKPLFCGPNRQASHHRPEKYFISSSTPKFETVYTSSINSSDTRDIMYYEDSRIGIGDRFYHGGDWLVTPPPYLYLLGTRSRDNWVSLALVVKKDEYNFNFFEYRGGEGWGLNLDYDGYTTINGSWSSPKVLLEMSDNVYEGLENYVNYLRKNGMVPIRDRSDTPRWWKEPIFGGWGEQMYHSYHWKNYEKSKSFGWSGSSADMCTMEAYDKMLATLEEKNIHPTILIVDNRWFREDCQLEVDQKLWPDMKSWIKKQHSKGRKVILWISPFSYSFGANGKDIPLNEHMILDNSNSHRLIINTDVFYTDDKHKRRQKKKTKEEYSLELDNTIAPDVLDPSYQKRVRQKIEALLSPTGLDADGFEFDYTHFGIHRRGFKRISGKSEITYGAELVHKILGIYYDQAKKTKPDALIITHTFNPYFDDVADMLRLQDIYTDYASIVDQMTHRAKVAKLTCPNCVIHTDQHPMPSLAAWREYAKHQSSIGNPCLYYVTGIETTHEKFTEEDFELIRKTWKEYNTSLDS